MFLRLIVWLLHRAYPDDAALKFLLDNPRRCFTHMFSSKQTRILIAANIGFLLLEYIMFLALDFDHAVLAGYPPHIRALMGWFQSTSTRIAGFNVMDVSALNQGMQVRAEHVGEHGCIDGIASACASPIRL